MLRYDLQKTMYSWCASLPLTVGPRTFGSDLTNSDEADGMAPVSRQGSQVPSTLGEPTTPSATMADLDIRDPRVLANIRLRES
jgi:hypothetical protein